MRLVGCIRHSLGTYKLMFRCCHFKTDFPIPHNISHLSPPFPNTLSLESMDKRPTNTTSANSEEVSSIEWEFINMTQQEEDLINRMYRLVGDRWDLIAGRIPGRKAEEIERFWIMRHGEVFAGKKK